MMIYEFLILWKMSYAKPFVLALVYYIILYVYCICDSVLKVCLQISLVSIFFEKK